MANGEETERSGIPHTEYPSKTNRSVLRRLCTSLGGFDASDNGEFSDGIHASWIVVTEGCDTAASG
jgi:hypothetical protein